MMRSYHGVKGGTPSGEPLCRSCRFAQYSQGEALSQQELRCQRMDWRELRWERFDCSMYEDKAYLPLHELSKIAWILEISKTRTPIGFISPEERRRRGIWEDEGFPPGAKW